MDPVEQIKIRRNMKVNDLVRAMGYSGVMQAGRLSMAVEILREMVKDKDCKLFFGVAGAMVPGGMRNIIIDILNNVDVFVTTGANLTHDLIESLSYKHYKGSVYADDRVLEQQGIDRIYDIFMYNDVYKGLERFFEEIIDKFPQEMNIREFLWHIGKYVKDRNSILNFCYEKKIPIFCPGIADSGIGLMIWNNIVKDKRVKVDTFDDLKEILDIAWTCKRAGVFYVGGGVPKNYIQQAMHFSKGADYGVQITMDRVETGGSSGAELKEGISWGKLKPNAKFVDLRCDATIALPIICTALKS